MKFTTIVITSIFIFATPISMANNSAGKVFGAGVTCTFSDGAVKQLPRELCKAYGGSHQ
ncbi:hypothetical protein V5098_14800 [Vibrio coralliirubri]|uniref:hypothetical protein n=1 Tax=Vibrio coralliirubri TaxID=1516159 RepID=UPI002FCECB15